MLSIGTQIQIWLDHDQLRFMADYMDDNIHPHPVVRAVHLPLGAEAHYQSSHPSNQRGEDGQRSALWLPAAGAWQHLGQIGGAHCEWIAQASLAEGMSLCLHVHSFNLSRKPQAHDQTSW